jgi:hypothetical protein
MRISFRLLIELVGWMVLATVVDFTQLMLMILFDTNKWNWMLNDHLLAHVQVPSPSLGV